MQKGACGHVSIDVAKEYAKKYDVPLLFNQGFGGTGALEIVKAFASKDKLGSREFFDYIII